MEMDLENRLKLHTSLEDIPDVFIQLIPKNVKIFLRIQYLIWCKVNNRKTSEEREKDYTHTYIYIYIYLKYI